jgi:hypothetical protein
MTFHRAALVVLIVLAVLQNPNPLIIPGLIWWARGACLR